MSRTRYVSTRKIKTEKQKRDSRFTTVILLYHSFASRMKALGNIAMIGINDQEKLVDRHISIIDKILSNYELILSVGHDAYKVQQYVYKKYPSLNIRCVENSNYEASNMCESLRLAINNTSNNRMLIINGNIVFEEKLLQGMNMRQSETIISQESKNETLDIGVNVNEKTNLVEHISYGALNTKWCEILYIPEENTINEMKKTLASNEFSNKVFYEFVNFMIQKNMKISYTVSNTQVLKINNMNASRK